jgi:transposase
MPETRKYYDEAFKAGAVRIVFETGKTIAQVARDLDVNGRTLGNWVEKAREGAEGRPDIGAGGGSTGGLTGGPPGGPPGDVEVELRRLRAEVEELRMERDVLKRSVVLWVKEATK